MFGVLRSLLILVLIGLMIVFVVQNAATVEVDFLTWSVQLPRAIVYFLIFFIGGVVGWLTRYFGARGD